MNTIANFREGQRVLIEKKVLWMGWYKEMDLLVGSCAEVTSVHRLPFGEKFYVKLSNGWCFPIDSLKIIPKKKIKTKVINI